MFRSIENMLAENGGIGGGAGIVMAVLMLVGGIIFVKSEKKYKKGNIALTAVYGSAAIVGFIFAGSRPELCFWAIWCFLCAGLAVASFLEGRKSSDFGMDDDAEDRIGRNNMEEMVEEQE